MSLTGILPTDAHPCVPIASVVEDAKEATREFRIGQNGFDIHGFSRRATSNTFYPCGEVGKIDQCVLRNANFLRQQRCVESADAEDDNGADIADDGIAE